MSKKGLAIGVTVVALVGGIFTVSQMEKFQQEE